jgi:hypothetical protein
MNLKPIQSQLKANKKAFWNERIHEQYFLKLSDILIMMKYT